MNFPLTIVDLAGSIALLLWGAHMVQTGIQRSFGPNLRTILGSALQNRFRAFLAGLGVTAVLQSSTATGLMTAGMAGRGLVDLVPALAVMLGANIGTTLIVQVFSLDIAPVSPALILVGVLMFRRNGTSQTHDLGRVFIGLGLMLLALHQVLDFMSRYEAAPSFHMLLGAASTAPLLDIVLAAGLAWAAHSSVAIVLFIMSLAAHGAFPLNAAFALVVGANLGSAINPVLEAPMGDDPAAKQVALGNLLARALGAALAIAALPSIGRSMTALAADNARAIADFHTLFNVGIAIVFLPLLTPYAALLRRWFPKHADADPSRPLYLEASARETPAVALGAAAREALRLADVLGGMLLGARNALAQGDRKLIVETRQRDDVLDRLNTAIKAYLTSLHTDELDERDRRRLQDILTFAMNLEQAGDVVDRNLLPHAAKRVKRGLAFSREGQAELIALMDRLAINLRTAASLFMIGDSRTARLLADEKVAFREAESRATASHFERLRSGRLDTMQTSALHLDLLRDMKLVNSHIVAAAAYPVLERRGELLPSRIVKIGR